MKERLEAIEEKYLEITQKLSDPEVLKDIKKVAELSKEQASLKDPYEAYQKLKKIEEDLEESKELVKDPELGDFAKEEITRLTAEKEKLEKDIEVMLLPKDPNDEKNVIVEIRGAAGGDEANIFAGDLYRMYTKYAEKQGWKIEVLTEEHSDAGGFPLVEFMVKGNMVYSKLKYESGSHRVQRVPVTETQGRVHTSTATVLVMPEAEEVDVDINPSDLRIDVYRSSGAGGQGVNTTDSAVRITHIPTGTVVTSQNERSQIQNKERCMQVLRARLYEMKIQEQEEMSKLKGEIEDINFGSQIRSYIMHPYSLVKDHRTNVEETNVNKVLDGDIDKFISANLRRNVKWYLTFQENTK